MKIKKYRLRKITNKMAISIEELEFHIKNDPEVLGLFDLVTNILYAWDNKVWNSEWRRITGVTYVS